MTLDHATCARLPAEGLASLAGLRRAEGISVVLDGGVAWVFWEPGDDRVIRAALPVPGVEFFERRGDSWHRAGRRLPCFEGGPPGPDHDPLPLSRAVFPAPFRAEMPSLGDLERVPLRLVRADRPRPTSAAFGSLVELTRWADQVPSAAIERLRGAIREGSALVLGRDVPQWAGSTRYWGETLLVPIGHEIRPALPEATLLEALGDSARALLRVLPDEGGDGFEVEAIPLEAFRPLTRAGIRLAAVGAPSP
jgi:hypothetical protein